MYCRTQGVHNLLDPRFGFRHPGELFRISLAPASALPLAEPLTGALCAQIIVTAFIVGEPLNRSVSVVCESLPLADASAALQWR